MLPLWTLGLFLVQEEIPDIRDLEPEERAPPPPPPPRAGFTSAPLCHLPPKPFPGSPKATSSSAAPARLLQTEPLKLPKKPWGFTSAPLMARPVQPVQPPAPPAPPPATTSQDPSHPNLAAIPRLPGRAGFTSSPLCTVPPKPRVAVGGVEALGGTEEPVPPVPPPPTVEERIATLPPVQAFRTNLQLWKRRASEAVQPLPKQLRGARSRMFSPPSSPKSAAGDFVGLSEDRSR